MSDARAIRRQSTVDRDRNFRIDTVFVQSVVDHTTNTRPELFFGEKRVAPPTEENKRNFVTN